MYTSYGISNERFGFSAKGSFRCAYENQRPIIIAFPIIMAALAVIWIVVFIVTKEMVLNRTPVDLADISVYQKAKIGVLMFGFDTAVYGTNVIALAVILCLIGLTALGYGITLGILRSGRIYTFSADDNYFEIKPPDKNSPTIFIKYDDVIMVYGEERKFIFAEHGLDITIQAKGKNYFFRYVHTPESRNKGLSETPFNILMERAGLIQKPDFLI